jgi:hypothetical protein
MYTLLIVISIGFGSNLVHGTTSQISDQFPTLDACAIAGRTKAAGDMAHVGARVGWICVQNRPS